MTRSLKKLLRHRVARHLVIFFAATGFLVLVCGLLFLFFFERKAFHYDIEAVGRLPKESVVIDSTNTRIGYLHGSHGSDLPLENISPHFLNAVIAREDSRFWSHHGVDHIGLVRAQLRNLKEQQIIQGASTITMQLARMTFELRERSVERKLVEMAIARRIERRYSKEEILRLYANRIYLGTGMHGIAEGAQGYFGKEPSALNLSEAAMLAGIIRAPNGVSPFRYPEAALREMRTTLNRMAEEGIITREEAEVAKRIRPRILSQDRWMKILKQKRHHFGGNWFLNLLEAEMEKLAPGAESYGGFTIRTTIDHRLQRSTEAAIGRWLSGLERVAGYPHPVYPAGGEEGEPGYIQGAGVVLENRTGAIRALVGGRDFRHSQFNRALHSNRQIGSVIKPLIYATAFENGLFPGTLVDDNAIRPGEFAGKERENWSPENADGEHKGLQPAEIGLIESRNTMTVRVGEWIGLDRVGRMLQFAGIVDRSTPLTPQVYLGNLTSSLLALTSAYTAFPNHGVRHEPFLVASIHDREGTLVYRGEPANYRLFSREAAWMTSSILEKVVEQGGSGSRLRRWGFDAPAGGKTGTTDRFVDAWFIGYTSRLTGGFWVGFDRPIPILEGAYGGRVALPVWKETMDHAREVGYRFEDFEPPEEIFPLRLCRHRGLLASPRCEEVGCAYTEQVPSTMIPRAFCDGSHRPAGIDVDSR